MCLCILIDNDLQLDYLTDCFRYDNKLENLSVRFNP